MKNKYIHTQLRLKRLVQYVIIISLGLSVLPLSSTSAAQITNRSLTLASSVSNATTTHTYKFNTVSGTAIQSIRFQYCTTATGACTVPNSWVNTGATLGTTTNLGTGFTVDLASNADSVGIKSATNVTAPTTPITVNITTVKNPTMVSQPFSFYVRILTYSDSTYTTALDAGSVAAVINSQILLTGAMPESLVFCTGGTINGTDCTTATSGSVSFNQDFSPTATSVATSQMVASTNAGSGYAITVNGSTMTSGSNTISGMNAATTSQFGVSQFGLNIMVNTTPVVGIAVTSASNGTNFRAQGNAGYNTADTFKFTTGDTVASSSNGSLGPSDAQNITASYIVNVPGSQPAGTYTTTLTYICTATF
jgi:hypothetical protein